MKRLVRWLFAEGGTALAAVCGVALLLLCSTQLGSAQTAVGMGQNPLHGSEVFSAKGCVKCHAVNGLGGTEAVDLGKTAKRRSFYDLAATLWNHVPLMRESIQKHGVGEAKIDSHEAGDLIGFLFTLDYFDAPGDVDAGKRLFSEKKCVLCHRLGNYGGDVGPDLDFLGRYGSPILVAAHMWNHGPAMADSMSARGVGRPTFQDSELVDLIAYLESVAAEPLEGRVYVLLGRAEAGRVIFVEKRCIDCHSIQGIGGKVGPDLSERGRDWSLTEFAAAMWNKAPAMWDVMSARKIFVPKLGAVEMADLLAYLYSVRYFAVVGDAEIGRQLLHDKGCLECHSLGGDGGRTAGDLEQVRDVAEPASLIAGLWNHVLLAGAAGEGRMGPWSTFSPEEMADVAAFLQELEANR